MVDPTVRLALALHSNRGAYAALLGSGISAAAGVPTGWQIVSDLISKVAALEGAVAGDDPIAWYRDRFGEEPDYSRLLDELAKSPTERSMLLRRYFEPGDDERRRNVKVPSAAHRALAQLAAKGYISVFLTTNFDRLLEQALEAAGVAPMTLSTPDSFEGSVPLGQSRCTVVKLNGDYLDTRIKNTSAELDSYHPCVDRLLDRVIDEYGLIVSGWSAEWDTALRRAFERCLTHRYTTFWASRNPPLAAAARLIELRRAEFVRIKDPNTLFTDLVTKLRALDGEKEPVNLPPAERVVAPVPPGLASRQATLGPAGAGLPARASALVGRRAEIDQIVGRLQDASVRLLTLVGPGGTGKTTLAIRAADDVSAGFPDGVCFVDLSSARDTNAVLVAIARATGLGEVIDQTLEEELSKLLRDRQALLLLDNFEQVAEAAGSVAKLLSDCPRLKVLVTSREALRVRAERVYPVPPLTLPPAGVKRASAKEVESCEAAQLFVDRAQASRPDFRLTDDNAPAVAEICRRLDGLPLAIELAAARLRLFSPDALRDQLQNRLGLLRSGPRDLPQRQQTLRGTLDWSYELLKPGEQRLFELLAVFADADVGAVEAVAARSDASEGGAADVLDELGSLIDKSLIRRLEQPQGESRIGMLETIREFAADRLEQRPDFSARARRAHATYYAEFARRLLADLMGSRSAVALAAMAAEVGNLRIAWSYWVGAGDLEQLEKLAESLLKLNDARGWYLDTVGLTTDMLSVLKTHASSPERVAQEIALRTSLARALMATKGFTPEVEDAFASAIELFERGTDARQRFSVLRGLAKLYELRGQVDKAAPLGREILALAERENDLAMQVDGHRLVGVSLMFVNDLQGGLDHLERAISMFAAGKANQVSARGGNDPRVACFTSAAFTLWLLGLPDRAVERVNGALTLAVELEHPLTSAFARFHSGLLHLWRRESTIARDRAESLLEIAEEHGFKVWTAAGTCLLGAAQTGLGRAEEGLANIRTGMSLYQGLRSPPIFWTMLQFIDAAASHQAGRPGDGLRPVEAAIEIMSVGQGTTLVPEFQILKGDLLLALAASDPSLRPEAERWYQLGFDRARHLNARMSQLRAATRLCRVRQGTVEHEAAARTLGSVYAAFTEGFGIADLLEARDLLDAVALKP